MRAGKKAAGSWGGVGLSSASGGNHVPHKCSVWPPWLRAGCGWRRGVVTMAEGLFWLEKGCGHRGWRLILVGEWVWSPWLRAGCGWRRGCHHGWGLAVVGEGVWPPWLRAGCGKRRGVPGKASSRDAVCPQLVTLTSVHFPTELLRGWTRRPSSHRGTLKRKVTRKGKYRTPVVKFEESLRSSPSQDMTSFCPTGYWGPLFSWQLLLLQTLGSPSAHQMK